MKQKWQEPKVEEFKVTLKTQVNYSYRCGNCGKYFTTMDAFKAHEIKCDRDIAGELPKECPDAPNDHYYNLDFTRVAIS